MPRLPQDSVFDDEILDMLAALRPLTVLRGPRGYGKTSLLSRWLKTTDGLPKNVYIALSTASNQDEGFWTEISSALVSAGLLSEDDVAALGTAGAVTRRLVTYPEPLLLVIDDMHEAGLHDDPAAIDEILVDLVRRNEQFYLVVAGRTLRAIETVGSLTVESAVIGPQELRLTGELVHRLASHLGVDLTMDGAQQIAVDLGGWPSAIRAGLVRSAGRKGSGVINHELIENYIITMVRDLRFEKMRSFLLQTAVPEEFDLETARQIVRKGNTARMLRNVHAAGLITERRTVNGPVYSFPPAIRAALLRVLHESRPQVENDIHRLLMRHWETKDEPARVLSHAVQAKEWALALDVLEQNWVRLLAEDPLTLVEAARRFPPAMIAEHPRLRVAADHLDGVRVSHGRSASWRGTESPTLRAEMAAQHEQLTHRGEDVALVLLHWGLTCTLQGRLDLALYAFAQARTAGMLDRHDGVAQLGTLGLALVHALQGEPQAALRWLEEPELQERIAERWSEDPSDFVCIVAALVKALASVDAAMPDAADAVRAIPEARHRDELWGLAVFVRAHHAVLTGHSDDVDRWTNELRAALRYIRQGSSTEVLLTGALIEALVLAGMGQVAHQVAARVHPHRLARVATMKLAMSERSYAAVIDTGTDVLSSNHFDRRTTMECYVLLAGAHHAVGERGPAQESFHSAVTIARETGQRRPFVLIPRSTFTALASSDPSTMDLWPGPESGPGPDTDVVDELTAREAEVLRALAVYTGPVGIARALGMSSNTVKTHLRSVYRKLHVANRADALAVLRGGRIPPE